MENFVVSSAAKAATKQSSITTFCVPGYRPPKRKYSPVKTRKRPVGRPSKKPRPAHLEPEAKDHNWNEWVRAVEAYDSELVTFYCTLYLPTAIVSAAEPVCVKVPSQRYTSENCFEVAQMLGTYSVRETARLMKMPKSTVQDIKKRVEKQGEYSQSKSRLPNMKGAGRPLTYPLSIDEELVSWILTMRDIHVPVSVEGLKEKARELVAPHNCKLKASSRWVKGFFKRHTLTLRAKTSLSQKLPAQLENKLSGFFVHEKK